jgi:hypothetical protein
MTLHPRRAPRVVYFAGALMLLAFCVVGVFYNAPVGVLGVLLFGFATANAALRLWHPRSYMTELDERGFRVYDAFGRRVHDVPWQAVVRLTVFEGNGLRGAGTVAVLAWRCEPRRPGRGRQPWVRGGVNALGEPFDGALPDAYLGIERMLALFAERAGA